MVVFFRFENASSLLKEKGWSEVDEQMLQDKISFYDFFGNFGPKAISRERTDLGELTNLFWLDIMQAIHEKITSNQDYCFKIQNEKILEITLQDVKNYFGIGLQMCIAPKTTIKDYWSNGKLIFFESYFNHFLRYPKKWSIY